MGGSSLLGRTHPVAVFGELSSAAELLDEVGDGLELAV
jgi:hypothetical protein